MVIGSLTKKVFAALLVAGLSVGCSRFQIPRADENRLEGRIQASLHELWKARPRLRTVQPSLHRLWRPELAVLPEADFDGNRVTIQNVRNCRYRTEEDYDVRHYNLEFDLNDVQSVDFVIVPFTNTPLLAHTMFSFGLRNGRHFLISVEARLEQGEAYSVTGGSDNEYELMYLIGDEHDLILLRTEIRQVDVYLYPGRATPDQVQNLLVDMLARVNKLAREPEFYDTFTNNCTNNLVKHINKLRPGAIPNDLRVLLPGHSDSLAYELGLLDIEGTFEVAKLTSRVNTAAQLYKNDPDFSAKIRRR
ncbi:MAG: DUF4105 domain-containing protein [Pirellulaceae bacterium]|nr:DUF4105 domain-containing protein [Pirellulaceae bacterium]